MSLKTSSKSFNRCIMQLSDWLHALGSVITLLQSSLIFTGYLFLNDLNSRFYYLPSRLRQQSPTYIQDLITRYLPSRSLRSPSTLCLNPVSFNLKTYGSRAFSVSAPELWNKLPDDIRSCENRSLFKDKLKNYLFKNFYLSHKGDLCDFTCVLFKLNLF